MIEHLLEELAALRRRIERQEARDDTPRLWVSDANVADPPTSANLDTAFGAVAAQPEGFAALVDDNNAHTKVWLAAVVGGKWWYVELTAAAV